MIRRFATPRQRRASLVAAVLGNVVPIVILSERQLHTEGQQLPIVVVGTILGILSPITVNLLPASFQWPLRLAGLAGLVGITMMQADTGQLGGIDSPYAILLVMPMLWFGLMTTGVDLRAGCAMVVACCFLPMWAFPHYYGRPSDRFAPAVALAVVAVSVALSLAGLTRETGRLTEELRSSALRDLLTGLLNRRGWEEVALRSLQDRSPRVPVCVALIDLDNLKLVNDSSGHDGGDALLRGTGLRLGAEFGAEAALARLGGDEFAVLVIGKEPSAVLERLGALHRAAPTNAGFSAGVAIVAADEDLRGAMHRADLALYEAKTSGRGRSLLADSARHR